jgi:predicted O-methyltransferase YrrM
VNLDVDRAPPAAADRAALDDPRAGCDVEEAHALLRRYRRLTGEVFDSDPLATFLYSLVRMHRCETVVELGSGLGSTALTLGLALRENGAGRAWTVDDFRLVNEHLDLAAMAARVEAEGLLEHAPSEPGELIAAMARRLGVEDRLAVVRRRIELDRDELIEDAPWAGRPVDLLFSDFNHGPEATVRMLAYWLERMAPSASIVIDSASTWWPTWLALEKLHELLSAGRVPGMLEAWGADLERVVARRRFTLVHLTRVGRSRQNGAAWLKIEPVDLVPHPATAMRSATSRWRLATPGPIEAAAIRRDEEPR